MTTKRFRKGELDFYKESTPTELAKYGKDFPDNKEYIDQFIASYTYNFVKKSWIKKEEAKNLFDRMKGEI